VAKLLPNSSNRAGHDPGGIKTVPVPIPKVGPRLARSTVCYRQAVGEHAHIAQDAVPIQTRTEVIVLSSAPTWEPFILRKRKSAHLRKAVGLVHGSFYSNT